jgi:hypothetical protein
VQARERDGAKGSPLDGVAPHPAAVLLEAASELGDALESESDRCGDDTACGRDVFPLDEEERHLGEDDCGSATAGSAMALASSLEIQRY